MYRKFIKDGYIVCLGAGEEITEEEYNKIFEIISNRPQAPENFTYKLTIDLEWELCKLPPIEAVDDEENL